VRKIVVYFFKGGGIQWDRKWKRNASSYNTDRQTDRQTDNQTNKQTNKHTLWGRVSLDEHTGTSFPLSVPSHHCSIFIHLPVLCNLKK
jgi:hypothetical protein